MSGVVLDVGGRLGANAEYVQPSQDRFRTRTINAVCGSAWADAAGTLLLEHRETLVAAWEVVASVTAAANASADLPWTRLTRRYYRFRYANGAAAQGADMTLVQQGIALDVDIPLRSVALLETAAPLAANAVFDGIARDFRTIQRANRFRVASAADQAGTLFVEQSDNGTNWVMTHNQATASVADANGTARHIARIDAEIVSDFARGRYRNGATAQTVFRVLSLQTGV